MFKQVAIIGGGLAGLVSGILLAKKGVPCILFERKNYPYPKVCGEYISNEATQFLKVHNLYPETLNPTQINTLHISSVRGQSATLPLDMGGFGVSRFSFDQFLSEKAREAGVVMRTNTEVVDVKYINDRFSIQTSNDESFGADVVIGAFGKRSKLDATLKRLFIRQRSPYVGVKYHVQTEHPDGIISLHNFPGGYCGVVNVEHGKTNICYLIHRDHVQRFKNIEETQKSILFQNRQLKTLFDNVDFKEKPLVINEISFERKETIYNHMLMTGDSAGMITPLCGNGMAMAIHSGKLAAEFVEQFCTKKITRAKMEVLYTTEWNKQFANRLRFGRAVQKLYNFPVFADVAIGLMNRSKTVASTMVRYTHGAEFY